MNSHSQTGRARNPGQARGFNLIELMVVVAIVGILGLIAYPSYLDYIHRSNRTEGQALLSDAAAREERYFSDNNTYTVSATNIGYGADPFISEHQYYKLTIAAGPTGQITDSYLLTVTAQGVQANDTKCLTMTLDSTGQKGSTQGTPDTSGVCWK